MKKIKEYARNNKVLIVLGLILICCFIAIFVVAFSFFFGGSKSVYGDRLQEIEKHEISDTFKSSFISGLKEDEAIESVSFDVKGKIIYVIINFADNVPLVDAESKASATLANFSEDILSYYDINFTLKSDGVDGSDGFVILGARNVAGSGNLIWNNNTPVESE